jgi:hypothetical protein
MKSPATGGGGSGFLCARQQRKTTVFIGADLNNEFK